MKFTEILLLIMIFCSCISSSIEEEHYENGQVKSIYKLKGGLREGEAFKYYSDGSLMQKSFWVKGEKYGLTETYYKNGKVNIQSHFENGDQQGWAYKYDSLGNLSGKTFYGESFPNGTFETYYQNKKIKSKGTFLNNGNESMTYFYFEDGTPERYEYLKNDSLIYLKKFNREGKLIASLLPISVSINDFELCVELQHSMIPKEALRTCLFIQNIDNMTVNLGAENLISKENNICIDKPTLNESIEGFLCECSGNNYECMPFKYLIGEGKMIHFDPVYF